MSGENRTVLITGAGGFLGSELASRFEQGGWTVRRAVRQPRHEGEVLCDLPHRLDHQAFQGVQVVIHAAYTMRFRSLAGAEATNTAGTLAVRDAALAAQVPRFLFISSCSAHDNAQSFYGRSKFALEQHFENPGGLVLRPGLIVGPGGLFARMAESVLIAPVIPLFDGGNQPVQVVALNDLCEATFRLGTVDMRGPIVLASPETISMRDLLTMLVTLQGKKHPRFLPLPSAPVLPLLRLAETLRLPLPISSENLLGLRGMITQSVGSIWSDLGIEPLTATEAVRQAVAALNA